MIRTGIRGLSHHRNAAYIALVLIISCIPCSLAAEVQGGAVQVFSGFLEPGEIHIYTVPDLLRGDILYAYAEGVSGNLDPALAFSGTAIDPLRVQLEYTAAVEREIAAGRDPLLAIPETADRFFYAWDDDSGPGYASSVSYQVRRSGDYQVILFQSPTRETSGAYRLLIGLNAHPVLDGTTEPTGDQIAMLNRSVTGIENSVQEISGNLSPREEPGIHWLNPVLEGDTLYASFKAGSGDVPVRLVLEDYGGKPVAIGVAAPESRVITLSHTFPESGEGYRLVVYQTSAQVILKEVSYRLLAGINEPSVLSGNAKPRGRAVFQAPITVYIGTELDQITEVNQKEENYAVVATIWMTWNDPGVAFSPDTCNCSFKLYRSISDFTGAEGSRFPEFTLFNQQERRWTQNELVIVMPGGTVTYFERFWSRLQAPDFDFKRYPFDNQEFHIRIDSLYPESYVVYAPWEEKTAIGNQLGEEEWVITSSDTNISTVEVVQSSSRYSFSFKAVRNLTYYIFRIFVPITIIIILTYIPFLLVDYGKRADIAAANLLLLVLFGFTITSDLPRLGYTTFLDIVLVMTFIISGFTVAYNLYLKWLATEKGIQLAKRIDHIVLWFYPAAYITVTIGLIFLL